MSSPTVLAGCFANYSHINDSLSQGILCEALIKLHHPTQSLSDHSSQHRVWIDVDTIRHKPHLRIIQRPHPSDSDVRLQHILPVDSIRLANHGGGISFPPFHYSEHRARSGLLIETTDRCRHSIVNADEQPSQRAQDRALVHLYCTIPAMDLEIGTKIQIEPEGDANLQKLRDLILLSQKSQEAAKHINHDKRDEKTIKMNEDFQLIDLESDSEDRRNRASLSESSSDACCSTSVSKPYSKYASTMSSDGSTITQADLLKIECPAPDREENVMTTPDDLSSNMRVNMPINVHCVESNNTIDSVDAKMGTSYDYDLPPSSNITFVPPKTEIKQQLTAAASLEGHRLEQHLQQYSKEAADFWSANVNNVRPHHATFANQSTPIRAEVASSRHQGGYPHNGRAANTMHANSQSPRRSSSFQDTRNNDTGSQFQRGFSRRGIRWTTAQRGKESGRLVRHQAGATGSEATWNDSLRRGRITTTNTNNKPAQKNLAPHRSKTARLASTAEAVQVSGSSSSAKATVWPGPGLPLPRVIQPVTAFAGGGKHTARGQSLAAMLKGGALFEMPEGLEI